jgi:hypothetical protein
MLTQGDKKPIFFSEVMTCKNNIVVKDGNAEGLMTSLALVLFGFHSFPAVGTDTSINSAKVFGKLPDLFLALETG